MVWDLGSGIKCRESVPVLGTSTNVCVLVSLELCICLHQGPAVSAILSGGEDLAVLVLCLSPVCGCC